MSKQYTQPLKLDEKLPKLKHSESELTITKNIESIIKSRDLSPMNELVHELSNKRLLKKQDSSLLGVNKTKLKIRNIHERT